MSTHRLMRASFATVTVAALAACATDPIAPRSAALPGDASLVTTAATPPEGVVQICKSGNASGSFDFEWTLRDPVTNNVVSGPTTTSVAVGSCVTIINGLVGLRYIITITEKAPLPANWAFTSLTWDYDPRGPTPVVTGQSITARVSNDRGLTAYFTNTYTPPPSGQIGDFVWNDVNGNGVQDVGEPGIAGVTVNLSGAATGSDVTDANGAYLFTGLAAGSYTVTVDASTLPSGYVAAPTGQGTPSTDNNGSPANVTLATSSSSDLTIDFGYRALTGPSCTRTQGYWKNHQELWDASGERVVWTGQTFFASTKTYAQIFAMSAAGGNSYIQLAHQYMAAKLNVNGGSDPVIDAAIAQAEALLGGHTAGSYFIKNATWTALAGTLDRYNNGVTGPGHCAG